MYRNFPVVSDRLPPGIPFIIGNEAAERFSFYGMRAILIAYMTLYLSQPSGEMNVFKNKEAEAWVHFFVGSAYLFPILGGVLSDAFLGKYKTIIILSFVYCIGHACLACMEWVGDTRSMLLLGLVLIALGSGGIKPCVSAHVGDQFGNRNRHLLSKVYGWFYLSINIGAFLSGLLSPFLLEAKIETGTVGEKIYPYFTWLVGHKQPGEIIFGHHYAFGLPGILMAIATLLFWMGRKRFTHIPAEGISYFLELKEKRNLVTLVKIWTVFSFAVLFWALFDQIGTLWQIQAREMAAQQLQFDGEGTPEQQMQFEALTAQMVGQLMQEVQQLSRSVSGGQQGADPVVALKEQELQIRAQAEQNDAEVDRQKLQLQQGAQQEKARQFNERIASQERQTQARIDASLRRERMKGTQ